MKTFPKSTTPVITQLYSTVFNTEKKLDSSEHISCIEQKTRSIDDNCVSPDIKIPVISLYSVLFVC